LVSSCVISVPKAPPSHPIVFVLVQMAPLEFEPGAQYGSVVKVAEPVSKFCEYTVLALASEPNKAAMPASTKRDRKYFIDCLRTRDIRND
jgi:hypothetical protein